MMKAKSKAGKLVVALALWAAAFVSVAQAQMPRGREALAVSPGTHATGDTVIGRTSAADRVWGQIAGENRLTPPVIDGNAKAEGPLANAWAAAARDDSPVAEPVLMAHAGEGPLTGFALASTAKARVPFPPVNCFSVDGQSPFFWWGFQKAETGFFATEFDVTPGGYDWAAIGLSQLPIQDDIGAYILFHPGGSMVVENFDHYDSTTTVLYKPGVKYHFVVYVNPQTQVYSVLVTPDGGSLQVLAWGFRFGYTSTPVTSLKYWDLFTRGPHTFAVCNLKVD
jgi:hypothetical protein